MNRAQFMEQLKKLLSDISEEERQEALDYYESYFDDAGEDQEANVIRELGSPGKVAAIIKADLKDSSQDYGEYTEKGFEDERVRPEPEMMQKRGGRAERGYHAERKGGNAGVILALILLVFVSPLIPVSYTHLDVYKRQDCILWNNCNCLQLNMSKHLAGYYLLNSYQTTIKV